MSVESEITSLVVIVVILNRRISEIQSKDKVKKHIRSVNAQQKLTLFQFNASIQNFEKNLNSFGLCYFGFLPDL